MIERRTRELTMPTSVWRALALKARWQGRTVEEQLLWLVRKDLGGDYPEPDKLARYLCGGMEE